MKAINFSQVKEAKPAGIQCGKYMAIFSEVLATTAKETKAPMWKATLKILYGKHKGKEVTDYIVFEGKEEKTTKSLLGKVKKIYIAIKGEEFANSTFIPTTEDLLGQQVMIDVVPKLNEFTGDDGVKRKTNRPVIDFAGYYPADDYMEIMDTELFDCPIYKEAATESDYEGESENNSEMTGDDDLPF